MYLTFFDSNILDILILMAELIYRWKKVQNDPSTKVIKYQKEQARSNTSNIKNQRFKNCK